ncbi:MAG: hypothetical protein NC084_01195 [Bacteroides sp.]|nr:hypothetical protein [Eubacterium sp.]MCM1417868.1 hypothetical protein [Roseburia sp.]MCM1461307.1 hypothetical protein [Bacteroides sp.]
MQNHTAAVTLHEMSLDEEVREMARLREKWILDEDSALRNAERRGIDKGKREGLKEGKREGLKEGKREGLEEAAQKMRRSGMTEDQIRKILNA